MSRKAATNTKLCPADVSRPPRRCVVRPLLRATCPRAARQRPACPDDVFVSQTTCAVLRPPVRRGRELHRLERGVSGRRVRAADDDLPSGGGQCDAARAARDDRVLPADQYRPDVTPCDDGNVCTSAIVARTGFALPSLRRTRSAGSYHTCAVRADGRLVCWVLTTPAASRARTEARTTTPPSACSTHTRAVFAQMAVSPVGA